MGSSPDRDRVVLLHGQPGVGAEWHGVVDALGTSFDAVDPDRVVPFASARALAARLPNAELVAVPRGGHGLHRTHPELIAGVVHRVIADAARQ